MTVTERELLAFWGKTPKPGEPAERYHPAIFHMLDVAFVAEALLREGAPRLRRALLHAWHGCDPEALLAWLPFLIALHDIGKISAAFQGQVEPQRQRLVEAGVRFQARGIELYHAEVSALWLHQFLQQREGFDSPALLWALRDAMGGHHGRFAEAEMPNIRKRLLVSERGEPRWASWRDMTYTLLRERLAPSSPMLAAVGTPHHIRTATAALTGFIIWCDWMGSNEQDFPASPELTVDQYMVEGRRRAAAALQQHALRATRPAPHYPGFGALFPEATCPRPLQQLVDTLPADELRGPMLAVIEAPTGEGKTEAALMLARRLAAGSAIDEIFFALPTMATGNQMFKRLDRFYQQQYGKAGAVRLTHSQAVALEADLRRAALANDNDPADPDGRSADAALEWFVGPKKAMLAPFGVGTVDQVELAGLNVRHYALRLFGLAGKVVVIDEVHAYDAYMSTILAHTLTWLARLGCSVILLSATLPAARHRMLAAAFLRGLGDEAEPAVAVDAPYPAVSLYGAGWHRCESCGVFRGEQRFTLRLAQQRTPEEEARYLLDLVRDGGAVARLCNRVDDAQAIYAALRQALPDASHVLLHARFPLHQRQQREERIEELVGKSTSRGAGDRVIIVGTQVLEQSLDYDVDVMVSDFAPIDLLLQRAGRLHRHNRAGKRPSAHAVPVLEVTLPYDAVGKPNWDRWAPIYAPYILWRSLAVLRARMQGVECEIVLPHDYRPLIEAVYGEADELVGSEYAAEIDGARERYRRELDEQQGKGRRPLTPDPTSSDPITYYGGYAYIDDESGEAASLQLAKTRLGDRITLVPLYRLDGELALDPAGTFRLSSDVVPDPEQQKDLLAHAVPLSDRRVIAAYRDERRPRELRWPWPERELPRLVRSLHPLLLDPQSRRATIADRQLRLDPDLGLVIEKADPHAGWIIEEDL